MSEVIKLGPFSPDISEVVRQLKQDMKDDWYPDSLGYEDVLIPNVAAGLLSKSFEDNHGLWVPEDRTELNIPKKGFILRYSLEMSLLDRLYYQALVGHLVPYFDDVLPGQVLNHRHAASGDRSGRYLFKQPIEQWELFRRYVAQEALAKPVILVTDIQNYYENIQVDRSGPIPLNSRPSFSSGVSADAYAASLPVGSIPAYASSGVCLSRLECGLD